MSVASFPLGALSTGCLFGFFVARQFTGRSEVASVGWAAAALFLLASMVVTWLRSIQGRLESEEGNRSRQLVLGAYLWLLIVREATGIFALVLIGIGGEVQSFAWIPALLGEIADRFLFFNTVIPVTMRGRYL